VSLCRAPEGANRGHPFGVVERIESIRDLLRSRSGIRQPPREFMADIRIRRSHRFLPSFVPPARTPRRAAIGGFRRRSAGRCNRIAPPKRLRNSAPVGLVGFHAAKHASIGFETGLSPTGGIR